MCFLLRFFKITFLLITLVFILSPLKVDAASLSVEVNNQASGGAVANAVVYALPLSNSKSQSVKLPITIIDQIDKEYVNHITVIQKGTKVSFPNHDHIRHHVYSFSPVKTFEIPLYLDEERSPISFDTTGKVSIGCNIHDWMSAFIYVVNTPYFAKSNDAGIAEMNLPAGNYDIRTWHPRLQGSTKNTSQMVTITKNNPVHIASSIKLKKAWKARRGPVVSKIGGGYR